MTSAGTATVEQSVVFGNGDLTKTYTITSVAGNKHTQQYNLLNRSINSATIDFVTSVIKVDSISTPLTVNDGDGDSNSIVGITVEYSVGGAVNPSSPTLAPGVHSFDTIITFDVALDPGIYVITTSVNPV